MDSCKKKKEGRADPAWTEGARCGHSVPTFLLGRQKEGQRGRRFGVLRPGQADCCAQLEALFLLFLRLWRGFDEGFTTRDCQSGEEMGEGEGD
jgi:hypothetical protein